MKLDRREAITLASGLAALSAIPDRAEACATLTLPFSAAGKDRERMSHKFRALRQHWNNGSVEEFVRQHCALRVNLDIRSDVMGGRWGNANTLGLFHERFPKIVGDFSGQMFDPLQPILYSMAVFDAGPNPPPHHPSDLHCGRSDFPPSFVIAMGFKFDLSAKGSTLSGGDNIVTALTFRASLDFDQRFYRAT